MRRLLTTFVLLSLALAVPAFARTRAVGHPTGYIQFTGTVVDSVTGQPVVGAEIVNEKAVVQTDAHGAFTLLIPTTSQTMVTIRRSGYESVTMQLQPNVPLTVQLKALPGVQVKMTNGQTMRLDFDSFQFVSAQPLSNGVSSPSAAVCKDGNPMQIDRSQFTRISNVVRASGAACCTNNTLWIDATLKDGTTNHVALVFDCMTYSTFVGGFEHDTHKMSYVPFENISEVTFP